MLQPGQIFTELQVKFYLTITLIGLEKLHSLKIIHRDLKSLNALLSNNGHCLLADTKQGRNGNMAVGTGVSMLCKIFSLIF